MKFLCCSVVKSFHFLSKNVERERGVEREREKQKGHTVSEIPYQTQENASEF